MVGIPGVVCSRCVAVVGEDSIVVAEGGGSV